MYRLYAVDRQQSVESRYVRESDDPFRVLPQRQVGEPLNQVDRAETASRTEYSSRIGIEKCRFKVRQSVGVSAGEISVAVEGMRADIGSPSLSFKQGEGSGHQFRCNYA